jgi:hypothetical protein
VDGSARLASRGQNSPQLRRAQVIQLIHISTSSRDDAVHAQRTRGDGVDGATSSGYLVLRISPGGRPWQQRGRRHRAGPGVTDHHRGTVPTAAVHSLRADHGAGLGLVPGNRQRLGKTRLARHRSAVGELRFGYLHGRDMRSAPTLRGMVHGQFARLVVCKATAPPGFGEARAGPSPLFNAPERPSE